MIQVNKDHVLPPKRQRYTPTPSKSISCTICGNDTEFSNMICFDCNCQIIDGDNSDISNRVDRSDFTIVDRTIQGIIEKVQEYTGIPDITIKTRKREIVEARQIAQYIVRMNTKLSLSEIGKELGGQDHATILYSTRKVPDLLLDKIYRKKYIELIEYYE